MIIIEEKHSMKEKNSRGSAAFEGKEVLIKSKE